MASLTTELMDLDISELDKLIHSFEFENQQCVKMIERKNQVISSLSSQIEQQGQERKRLEEEISRFDEDTKRLHRNYTNNRDNIACLKNTMAVMSDHVDALSKQLSALQIKTCEESKTYKEHLSNYTKTRDEYMAKYRAFPLALKLEEEQKVVVIQQEREKEIGEKKNSIAEQISTLEEELGTKAMTRIVVKIVQSRFKTQHLESKIHEYVTKKTILLEQLKEVQKSKQQAVTCSVTGNLKAPMETMDETPTCDTDQTKICNESNQFANMCTEENSLRQPEEARGNQNITQEPPGKANNIDFGRDESLIEMGQSTEQRNQPLYRIKPTTAKSLSLPPQMENSFVCSPEHSPVQIVQTAAVSVQNQLMEPSATKSVSVEKDNSQKTLNINNMSLTNPHLMSHQEAPGLGRPRLSVPRFPSLRRMPIALRVPSLNVPRPLRIQQPRFISAAQAKISTVLSKNSATDCPKMKEPSPPPPRAPTAPTIMNTLVPREQSAVPTINSTKGNLPPARAQIPPSSSSLVLKQQQPQKIGDGKTANSEQIERGQVTTREQPEMLLPHTNWMPLNDVSNEPMTVEEGQDGKAAASARKGMDLLERQNPPFHSTPTEKEDIRCEDEPLFKLVHTFGSQSSLGSSIAPSQQMTFSDKEQHQEQFIADSGDHNSVFSKSSLRTHLEAASKDNPCSPTGDVTQRESEHKSIFNLFTISQKSCDTDTTKEEDNFVSIFNFGNYSGVNEGENIAETSTRWLGSSNLLGMAPAESDQSQEVTESDTLPFKFGSSKDMEEDGNDPNSFFNFGGSNFKNDDNERPIFNLF